MPSNLLTSLRDPDENVRIAAALELGKLADASTAPALVEAMCAEDRFFVRETITWSIVRLGAAAAPLLIARLRDPDQAVRRNCAHALSKIGDPRAVEPLIEALGDADPMVISKAAFALGQLGDTRAVPPLVALLGHEDRDLESTVNTVLQGFGEATVEALIQALGGADWRRRQQAADALRVIGAREAGPFLLAALGDGSWQVRFAAAHALGEMGLGPQALETIGEDPDARVRALARRLSQG